MNKQTVLKVLEVIFCKLNIALKFVCCFAYDLGVFVLSVASFIFKYVAIAAKAVYKVLKICLFSINKVLGYLFIRRFIRFFGRIKTMILGFIRIIRYSLVERKENGIVSSINLFGCNMKEAYGRHKKELSHLVNYLAPAGAAVALLITVSLWSNVTFALEVKYSGGTIGYITDESVYNKAADMAEKKVVGGADKIDVSPEYSLTIVDSRNLTTAAALSDKLIKTAKNLVNGYGLYIDGTFIAATTEKATIDRVLDSKTLLVKGSFYSDKVSFVKNIDIKAGIFGSDYIYTTEKLALLLTDSVLPIQYVATQKTTAVMPFSTVEIKDNTMESGTSKVKIKGVSGLSENTDEVSYVNGKEISRVSVGYKVLTKAVNKEVIIGTKKVVKVSLKGKAIFSWPVARVAGGYISSYFGDGRNHPGIDFATHVGTSMYAAMGGTVVAINNERTGYGLSVKIDHGNGYQTLYAHCSKIDVTVGQVVNTGEEIGKTGNTGNTTGPHLHFEIHLQGAQINPASLLGL